MATAIADEALGEDAVEAGVGALAERGLGVAIVHAEDAGPERPPIIRGALRGRLAHELQVYDVPAGAINNSRPKCVEICT